MVLQTCHRKGNVFLSQHCKKKNSYTKPSNRGILLVGELTNSLLSIVIIHYWGVATADLETSGLTVNHKKGKKEGVRV